MKVEEELSRNRFDYYYLFNTRVHLNVVFPALNMDLTRNTSFTLRTRNTSKFSPKHGCFDALL